MANFNVFKVISGKESFLFQCACARWRCLGTPFLGPSSASFIRSPVISNENQDLHLPFPFRTGQTGMNYSSHDVGTIPAGRKNNKNSQPPSEKENRKAANGDASASDLLTSERFNSSSNSSSFFLLSGRSSTITYDRCFHLQNTPCLEGFMGAPHRTKVL